MKSSKPHHNERYEELPIKIRRVLHETGNLQYTEGDASIATNIPLRYSANSKLNQSFSNSIESSSDVSIKSSYSTISNVLSPSITSSSSEYSSSSVQKNNNNLGLNRFLNRSKHRSIRQRLSTDENQDPLALLNKNVNNMTIQSNTSNKSAIETPKHSRSMINHQKELVKAIESISNEKHQAIAKGANAIVLQLFASEDSKKIFEKVNLDFETYLSTQSINIPSRTIEKSLRVAMLVIKTAYSTFSETNNKFENQLTNVPLSRWKQLVSESIFYITGKNNLNKLPNENLHQVKNEKYLLLNSLPVSSISKYTAMIFAAIDAIVIVCSSVLRYDQSYQSTAMMASKSLSSSSSSSNDQQTETNILSQTKISSVSDRKLTKKILPHVNVGKSKDPHIPLRSNSFEDNRTALIKNADQDSPSLQKSGRFLFALRNTKLTKKNTENTKLKQNKTKSLKKILQVSEGSETRDKKYQKKINENVSKTIQIDAKMAVKAVSMNSAKARPRAQVHRLGKNFISKVAGDEVEIILLNPQRSRHNR